MDAVATALPNANSSNLLGKAIAMNARKNGSLKSVSIKDWFNSYAQFESFLANMNISDKDHELWYGDKKEADNMEKDQLVKKFHCALEYVSFEGKN